MTMISGNHHKDRELGRKHGQGVMHVLIESEIVNLDFHEPLKEHFSYLPRQAVVFFMT